MELIFVVEDHEIIRKGIGAYLENSGYQVELFATLLSVKTALKERNPDLIIQDIMLPDGDGAQFIQELRKTNNVPVIFMTAKIAEPDRIHGFEIGADDYITKPFSPKELVLRVQAVLRRSKNAKQKSPEMLDAVFKNGNSVLKIAEKNHSLVLDDKDLLLTAAEWRIFLYLIKNRDRIISRAEILKECFDYENASYDRIADTHVKNLRSKLENPNLIETVRGFGYRFSGEEI